jgi:serine/threonine protein phosphatase PrpC
MSTIDTVLMQAYLANIQAALQNLDVPHAEMLVTCAQKLLAQPSAPSPADLPTQISTSIGLDTGITRQGKPNEDFAFAATGCNTQAQEADGLFLVADGVGGHANGQVASRLAAETIVNIILPFLHHACIQSADLENLVIDAVARANAIIYEQDQGAAISRPLDRMGTTLTVAAVFGIHAFIAHVGDSRAYLYRPGSGLRAITHDHSVVANLVASGAIQADEIYTHPKRNVILRCLGTAPTVEADLFYEQLQDGDILLLCTDGVWEMARDSHIEQILSSTWLSADLMVERLVRAALQAGGADNIGLVISQIQVNLTAMPTLVNPRAPFATIS